jgi:protein-S-isoprenylcysteine O-methyltransferase Ste14
MLSSVVLILTAGAVFGIFHTTLAAKRTKQWARRRWGAQPVDRWYRLFFSLAAVMTFLPVLILTALLPDRHLYSIPTPWVWLTTAVQGITMIIFVLALFQTDVMRFIGLRQMLWGGDPIPADRHERLVTSGPYARVRHPLYTTTIIVMWLWPNMTLNLAAFFAVSTAYFSLGSLPEEDKLVDEFGDAYRHYQEVVPRLIPRPRRMLQARE